MVPKIQKPRIVPAITHTQPLFIKRSQRVITASFHNFRNQGSSATFHWNTGNFLNCSTDMPDRFRKSFSFSTESIPL